MPPDQSLILGGIIPPDYLWVTVQLLIALLALCYFLFTLIVVRQVHLMSVTVVTGSAPTLRAFSIVHAGFALGIIILFIGVLF